MLVTGGQRGLGKAIAEEALLAGADKVYVTARSPAPSSDPRVVPLALDVTDPVSVKALVDQVGDVTIVVNNAGISVRGPITAAPLHDVEAIYTATDMTAGLDVQKNDPRDVARAVIEAVENGETEVLADDVSRRSRPRWPAPWRACP